MKKNFLIVAVIILVIVGALAGVKALQIKALMASGASFSMPPETISGAEVKEETWEGLIPAIGSVSAVQGAAVARELAGTVSRSVHSGANAAKEACWSSWTCRRSRRSRAAESCQSWPG
jgi:membrane fusion protein (multidrug efflux system)